MKKVLLFFPFALILTQSAQAFRDIEKKAVYEQVSAFHIADQDYGFSFAKGVNDFDERRPEDFSIKNLNITPLMVAAVAANPKLVQTLIGLKADFRAKDKNDNTPLHWATRFKNQNYEVVQTLIAAGADVNAKDSLGATPLHNALDKSIIQLLIMKGADIEAKDKAGNTPLMALAKRDIDKDPASTMNAIQALLATGASLDAKNNKGQTALDIAKNKWGPKAVPLVSVMESAQNKRKKLIKALDAYRRIVPVKEEFIPLAPPAPPLPEQKVPVAPPLPGQKIPIAPPVPAAPALPKAAQKPTVKKPRVTPRPGQDSEVSRSALFEEIKTGRKLKPLEERQLPEKPLTREEQVRKELEERLKQGGGLKPAKERAPEVPAPEKSAREQLLEQIRARGEVE